MINTPKLQFHTGLCGLSPHIIESFRSEKIFKITEPTIVGYTNVRARTHTGEKKTQHISGVYGHTHTNYHTERLNTERLNYEVHPVLHKPRGMPIPREVSAGHVFSQLTGI